MTHPDEQAILRMVLEALPVGIYAINRQGKITLWNSGAERLSGYLRQDVLGRFREEELWEGIEHEQRAPRQQSLSTWPERDAPPSVTQFSLRTKTGRLIPVELHTVVLRDELGEVVGAAKVFQPLCETETGPRRQQRLAAFGALDPLTGLLNHSMIQAHLRESLSLHALYPVPFSVLCCAVDDLPKIRERYGQAAVDATLRMVARTLENALLQTDFVGRWLDEEFVAILPECGEADVMKVGERIRKLVQHSSLHWWGDTLHVAISIGATVVHSNDTVSSLVNRAEQALRQSSGTGGNRVTVVSAAGAEPL
jgi:diguanylate cyclase (GGDEF)-like protein/PAS domain S-box-containing protein